MKKGRIATIIRGTARIWSSLIIGILILFSGSGLYEHFFVEPRYFIDGEPTYAFKDIFLQGFILVPIFLIIGYVIAFKREGLGGLIIIVTITAGTIELILEGALDATFAAVGGFEVLPGVLFLIYWYLSRGQKETIEAN